MSLLLNNVSLNVINIPNPVSRQDTNVPKYKRYKMQTEKENKKSKHDKMQKYQNTYNQRIQKANIQM